MQTIEIRQGDSSNFFYKIQLEIDTELDLTGYTGYFQVGALKPLNYPDITSKVITIELNNKLTSRLRPGEYTGYLKLITPTGDVGTSEPVLIIKILPEVVNVR